MNDVVIAVIVLIIALFIIFSFILISGYNKVTVTIPESNCDELLEMIQRTGMKPNYQYDVREWIAKECWK